MCTWLLWLSKCAMVMTKIECYLPAIYRLNQELLREVCRIDTLYYKNENNQISYTLPHMLIKFFSVDATMYTKSSFSLTCPNVSTTHVTVTGCRQCLPLSVVQLKGKHC